MITYLLINTVITCWALLIQRHTKTDVSTQFHISIAALISWFFPYGLFSFESQLDILNNTQPILISIKKPVIELIHHPQAKEFPWSIVFSLAFAFGLVRFAIDLFLLHKQHNLFLKQGKETSHSGVYTIKNLNNACITGFQSPLIWIDENLYNSKFSKSIIAHEKQHISFHDQYWLLLINFTARLFWFNPLVRKLSNKARLNLEMRCDVACHKADNANYQNDLAQLLLHMNLNQNVTFNQMSHSRKNNMNRVKYLKNYHQHNGALAKLLSVIVFLCSFSVFANENKPDYKELKSEEIVIKFNWKEKWMRNGIENTTELNSEIVVNENENKKFEFNDYNIELKAQLASKDVPPRMYLIETNILTDKPITVSSPIILVEEGKVAIIRLIIDENTSEPATLELSYLVVNRAN